METEHKNVFEPQPMPDPGKHKELTGPMFKIDRKHQYTGLDMQMSDIDAELDTAKKISTDLVGPVYDADLSVNHFKEVVMHAEAIREVDL